jgi:hypothetical protein
LIQSLGLSMCFIDLLVSNHIMTFLMSLDFGLLSNQDELQNLTNTIGEMLGTFQKSTPTPSKSK